MANINVSYDEMRTAATRLTGGQEDINTKLTDLKGFIEGLVSSGFVTDSASVKFNETYTNFNTSATQTIASLTELSTYLTSAANSLQDADTQLAAGLG